MTIWLVLYGEVGNQSELNMNYIVIQCLPIPHIKVQYLTSPMMNFPWFSSGGLKTFNFPNGKIGSRLVLPLPKTIMAMGRKSPIYFFVWDTNLHSCLVFHCHVFWRVYRISNHLICAREWGNEAMVRMGIHSLIPRRVIFHPPHRPWCITEVEYILSISALHSTVSRFKAPPVVPKTGPLRFWSSTRDTMEAGCEEVYLLISYFRKINVWCSWLWLSIKTIYCIYLHTQVWTQKTLGVRNWHPIFCGKLATKGFRITSNVLTKWHLFKLPSGWFQRDPASTRTSRFEMLCEKVKLWTQHKNKECMYRGLRHGACFGKVPFGVRCHLVEVSSDVPLLTLLPPIWKTKNRSFCIPLTMYLFIPRWSTFIVAFLTNACSSISDMNRSNWTFP